MALLKNIHLPGFIYNQAPDFLWMYASMSGVWLIWKNNLKELRIYQVIMLLLAILLEVCQRFKIVPGTFDWYDIAAYFLAFILNLTIIHFNH
jgi:hypothetical protein